MGAVCVDYMDQLIVKDQNWNSENRALINEAFTYK